MNIFVTSSDPVESARALDDKRVIKMVLETAQMLCTALRLNNGTHLAKYKSTHENHPCNIWVRTSRENYQWTIDHFAALLSEYNIRSGKIHACESMYPDLASGVNLIPAGALTPFANCAARKDMNLDFKHLEVTLAYKLYLLKRWNTDKRPAKWTSDSPFWFKANYNLFYTFYRLGIK